MRVLIFGASGMLGHKLYQRLRTQFDVNATVRSDFESIKRFGIFEEPSIIVGVDVTDPASIKRAIELARPDCVINAVGIIKQVPTSKDVIQTLTINSILPHRLAELSAEHGFRLITISTDCVFDGSRGNYSEDDAPNAGDLYGMSKLLGEVDRDNSLTIRTSIIGRELDTSHSLVEWFIANRGKQVKGFTKAIYSGFPTTVFADIIAGLIADHPELRGLYHISSDPVSKFDLLRMINEQFDLRIKIEPLDEVVIDRSLNSGKFRTATGFVPAPWGEMIAKMRDDTTPYDKWRQ